jgi:curli biogenesis system outer membrane secretion channel CsgG
MLKTAMLASVAALALGATAASAQTSTINCAGPNANAFERMTLPACGPEPPRVPWSSGARSGRPAPCCAPKPCSARKP